MSKLGLTPEERFWSFVHNRHGNGCWTWMGGKYWDGYGQFYVERHKVRAHRFSYELTNGTIPAGVVIHHECSNRACVRPDHLRPTTNRENVLLGVGPSAQAAKATHCPQGHEYSAENTRVTNGYRVCRTCHREREARRRKESA